MKKTIEPGSIIGVLGSGQLGRMFAIAARRLGYRAHVLSPDDDTPTGQVADVEVQAAYDDVEAVRSFAQTVDVLTFEFENIPQATLDVADQFAPVRPMGKVLHTTQQRIREKTFLSDAGIPVTPFRPIGSSDDLQSVNESDLPGILKTAAWGYDGKGQVRVDSSSELDAAWAELNGQLAILEKRVDFDFEMSVIGGRGQDGEFASFGPIVNEHRNHILDVSVAGLELPPKLVQDAIEITRTILEELEVVGLLCVEFFVTRDGHLLVNELAPRPHNSGHLTIDAHATCQFEQQARAVCGMPLGDTRPRCAAAMANLQGELWEQQVPNWSEALRFPNVKLHLYGKKEPRRGRKMGHLTALAETPSAAKQLVLDARRALEIRRDTVEQSSPDACHVLDETAT